MKIESDDVVTLSSYDSDLNLVIDSACYSAHPLTNEGFAFMWAGARSTHGVFKGKACFEVKVLENLDVSHLPADEPNPHVVRIGFSVEQSSLQLGEDPLSYGYGGTGKISTNCQFRDYGTSFMAGDVILSVVDMDSEKVRIGFGKNGKFLGWAYHINKSELKAQALFPHILTKNVSFVVNFGQKDSPYFPLPDIVKDFYFIGCLPFEKKFAGCKAPDRRECEMIMMCGLPGCGKSVWAEKYVKAHPEKKYNVLGTNNIIDKMKVMGLSRKRNYHGRWDVLIKMATQCLNKMFEIGSKMSRNYILDQTNVYPSAQKRKMKKFDGFKRIAVVIVPTEMEFKRRCDKRDKEEGKEIPESAVLEMKANFGIPPDGDLFHEIIFPELQREEAEKLVAQYNAEGKGITGPPPRKQFKSDYGNDSPGFGQGGYDRGGWGGNRGGFNRGRGGLSGGAREGVGYDSGHGDTYGESGRGRGGYGCGRGGFDGARGGYDNGREGYGGGRGGYDGARGGFDSGRGGYDSGRGGYDSGRGGNGSGRGGNGSGRGSYDSGRGSYDSGRGGYDSGRGGYSSGRGGYDSGRGGYGSGRGGYDSGRGGYDSGRGGYDTGRGGYDTGRGGYGTGRGGYESKQEGYESGRGGYQTGGGYESGRGEIKSESSEYESAGYDGGRGGYDSGRGGYNSGRGGYGSGRGGYDSGSGGYDSGRGGNGSGRGGNVSGRGGNGSGRGGYDSGRGGYESGQGGFDRNRDSSQSGRGGYDSGRAGYDSGRGGYDSGRGGYDSGRGGYDSGRGGYDSGRGGYDSGRGGYDSGRGGYESGQGGFDSGRGGYDSGRGGYESGRGGFDRNRDSSQSGYDRGRGGFNSNTRSDSPNRYGDNSGFSGASRSLPTSGREDSGGSRYMGTQERSSNYGSSDSYTRREIKTEPGTPAAHIGTRDDGVSRRAGGRVSRWSALPDESASADKSSPAANSYAGFSSAQSRVPVKEEPTSSYGSSGYDSSANATYGTGSGQASQPYGQSSAQWGGTQYSSGSIPGNEAQDKWSNYPQQSQSNQYYNQYYGQSAGTGSGYGGGYGYGAQ